MDLARDRLAGIRPELPARRGIVPRRGLLELLSSAPSGCVVLVCAPAGSGKTELLRWWVEAEDLGERIAWVGVERGEQDAQHFWLAVVNALADATGREELVERTDPAPGFRGEAVVERLLSDLDSLSEPLVLVIDDLHELDSSEALASLHLFGARLPARLRLVLASREEPRLGLHRLRLAGRLTEIRDPDLRFSLEEARELLEASGIELPEEALVLLHERTEGWAAGLRLAAISLARHPDPERFVSEFSGSERTVAGYLMAEVLDRQPPEVRELLLRTSILDRVSGPLADFLTGGFCSERILQELEDANAFVSSLDATRSWFRYHHLFADLLQLELRRTNPASIEELHRKAAVWHEEHGYPVEAIRHAQAAGDWSHAAHLLADNCVGLILDGRRAAVRGLLDLFPPDASAGNAELALAFAVTLVVEAAIQEIPAYINLAQRLADTVPEGRRRRFELQLAAVRLALARRLGDLTVSLEMKRSMEALLAAQPAGGRDRGDVLRAIALQESGIAELWSLRLDDARRDLEQALELIRRAGQSFLQVSCLAHLAIARAWTGLSLAAGLELSEEAVRIAEEHGWMEDQIVVTGLAGAALALLLLGRFDEAERSLERAGRAMRPGGEPGTELLVHHARGVLGLVRGAFEEAFVEFRGAERMDGLLTGGHAFAVVSRARRLQAQAGMGQLAEARAALAELPEEERDTSYMRVSAAKIHLAEGDAEQAVSVLALALQGPAPPIHHSPGSVEAAVLDAVARERLGDRVAAEASLERALEHAEPEGIILPFALAPVKGLLERHPRHSTAHASLISEILDVLAGSSAAPRAEALPLLDELSEAELRVIRYLPSNLKAPEIAAELFVSPNTVRTHLRHIYAKLGVHGRGEAVERARGLGLVAPRSRLR
ncbi:MAG: LuxR C-terminal-related transcriptional regulator [Solirubrobacterales bacterium]